VVAKVVFHESRDEKIADADGFESTIKEFNKDGINRWEAGAAFGLGYRLKGKGWSFGLRFYHGFTNVYKNRSGTKNRAMFFKVNVPVGAGKAKKKAEATKEDTLSESADSKP
jgi:hypothetical protein